MQSIEDTIIKPFSQWKKSKHKLEYLLDKGFDCDHPEVLVALNEYYDLSEKICRMVPTSLAGIRCQAELLRDAYGDGVEENDCANVAKSNMVKAFEKMGISSTI